MTGPTQTQRIGLVIVLALLALLALGRAFAAP